jgi:stress response protein YsnF
MTRAPLSQLDDWQLVDSDQDIRGQKLQDERGDTLGTIREMIVNTDTEYVEAIVLDDGREIPASAIRLGDDAVYLRQAAHAPAATGAERRDVQDVEGEITIPIVAEEIRVGKREVLGGGVRVNVHVEETPVEKQVTLRNEEVEAHREQVDRPLSEAEAAKAFREGAVEIREHDEQAVIAKQARVVEEVVIDKDVRERTEQIEDTVRRTDVDVEKLPGREPRE